MKEQGNNYVLHGMTYTKFVYTDIKIHIKQIVYMYLTELFIRSREYKKSALFYDFVVQQESYLITKCCM